ncbi:MAG: MotA/TolQ/ExbB proton channel family protein [Pirellulales bacterium]|nr:MotA/TolQ/ExbB proton channel family protein [Pirellulales bacterium]
MPNERARADKEVRRKDSLGTAMLFHKSSHRWRLAAMILPLFAILIAWMHLSAQAQDNSPGGASEVATNSSSDSESASTPGTLLGMIRNGGPLIIPIGICSFVLVIFIFERAMSLRRAHIIPKPFVKKFLHQLREGQLKPQEALETCEENGSAISQVFAGAVRKWGRPAVEVEQGVLDAGERVANHLRRHLRVINGVATVTPLMGLLGTVMGMIRAMDEIAIHQSAGSGGTPFVAGGISQALITTAAGLTVAIPALIAYLYFVGSVDRRVMEIDMLGQEAVDLIAADGGVDLKRKSSSRKKAA